MPQTLSWSDAPCQATHTARHLRRPPNPRSSSYRSRRRFPAGISPPATPTPAPNRPPIPVRKHFARLPKLHDQLVTEVQARNPSLQAASLAWRAAANRYPQVVSLDDPMFTYMMTPTNGLGADNGGGWMVQGAQKIPWAGKRALRGSAAAAAIAPIGTPAVTVTPGSSVIVIHMATASMAHRINRRSKIRNTCRIGCFII